MAKKHLARIRHFAGKKKEVAMRLKAKSQDYTPVTDVTEGMVIVNTGSGKRYLKILEIEPINFHMRSASDRASIVDGFYSWLKIAPDRIQILVSTVQTNTQGIIRNILLSTAKEPREIRNEAKAYAEQIRDISSSMATSKRYLLVLEYSASIDGSRSKDEHEIALQLAAKAEETRAEFAKFDVRVILHDDENAFLVNTLYDAMNQGDIREDTMIRRANRLMADMKRAGVTATKPPVSAITAPASLDFTHPSYYILDGMYRTSLYLKADAYPEEVPGGWVDLLTNFGPHVQISLHAVKRSRDAEMTSLKRTMRNDRASISINGDKQEKLPGLMKKYNNEEYILHRITEENEDLYDVCVIFTISAPSLKELSRLRYYVQTQLRSRDIATDDLFARHEAAFWMSLPLLYRDTAIFTKAKRNFLTSSLASTFPFTAYQLFEEKGVLFGINEDNGSLTALDPFYTNRRINANMLITGSPGAGKTFTEMLLGSHLRFSGIQVFYVLPMKGYEYYKAVKRMKGTFVNFKPGTKTCANLFELRPESAVDGGLVDVMESSSLLTKKIRQIKRFISLLSKRGLDAEIESLIDKCLINMYERFGITTDNSSIINPDGTIKRMPIFTDFYNELSHVPEMRVVQSWILPFVSGSCSNFNGQTNVDMSNKCIAFDVDTDDVPESIHAALLFLAIDLCYSIIKRDRTENNILFLDEVWKMTVNEDAAKFVDELFRILRGYGAGVWAATQEIESFIGVQNGQLSRTVLNCSAIKIALRAEDTEAAYIQELLDLTEAEARRITHFERGSGLMIAGRDRVPIRFTATEEEIQTFTTDTTILKKIREEEQANAVG